MATVPQYNLKLTWNAVVVCPFVPAEATGTYTITKDTWDGSAGEQVTVTGAAGKATIDIMFPYAAPPGINPVVVTVNPTTGAATVAKQTYGSYGAGFENFTAEGTGGFFFSCTGGFSINLTHKLPNGTNYGTYPYAIQKN